jgi:leader peptidase (prepilin peptidase)/N-methyltransferase
VTILDFWGWYLVAACFLMGSAFGSFGNVVIHRLPRGLSLVRPRSACPECGAQILWYDNLPLVSFAVLRGRCRNCRARISRRFPVVVLLMASLWALVGWRIGLRPELPAFLAFTTVIVVLSFIDLEHRRLPNRIVGPATLAGLILLLIAAAVSGDWRSLVNAVVGAVAYGVPMLLLALAFPSGMGGGDVNLAAYLGLHLGWFSLLHVLVGAMSGFFLGGFVGIALLAARKKGRKDPIPFGPFMALGGFISALWGSEILRLWLG